MSQLREKRINIILNVVILLLVIYTLVITFITNNSRAEVKPDPVQYYGEVVSIEVESDHKIIRVKGASTPYPQHDNYLEGEVVLIAPEDIGVGHRVGPSNESSKLNIGDLTIMYDSLAEGDEIAFRFKDLVFEDRKEVEKIIFTGH